MLICNIYLLLLQILLPPPPTSFPPPSLPSSLLRFLFFIIGFRRRVPTKERLRVEFQLHPLVRVAPPVATENMLPAITVISPLTPPPFHRLLAFRERKREKEKRQNCGLWSSFALLCLFCFVVAIEGLCRWIYV